MKNHFPLWASLGSFVNVYAKQFQFRKIFSLMLIPEDKKIECLLKSGFIINNDKLYQDETETIKITLGNNCGEIDAGEINSSLGNKSLRNDWGGVGNDYSKKNYLTLTKISLQI